MWKMKNNEKVTLYIQTFELGFKKAPYPTNKIGELL